MTKCERINIRKRTYENGLIDGRAEIQADSEIAYADIYYRLKESELLLRRVLSVFNIYRHNSDLTIRIEDFLKGGK